MKRVNNILTTFSALSSYAMLVDDGGLVFELIEEASSVITATNKSLQNCKIFAVVRGEYYVREYTKRVYFRLIGSTVLII